MSPAQYVIEKIGGLTKTARALSIPVTTVQGWKERGRVPQEHWTNLIAAAHDEGKKLQLEDFLREHEDEASAA